MTDDPKRVDRSYLAERNRAILSYAAKHPDASYDMIAQNFGLERETTKRLLRQARTITDADIAYLGAPYAKPYSQR